MNTIWEWEAGYRTLNYGGHYSQPLWGLNRKDVELTQAIYESMKDLGADLGNFQIFSGGLKYSDFKLECYFPPGTTVIRITPLEITGYFECQGNEQEELAIKALLQATRGLLSLESNIIFQKHTGYYTCQIQLKNGTYNDYCSSFVQAPPIGEGEWIKSAAAYYFGPRGVFSATSVTIQPSILSSSHVFFRIDFESLRNLNSDELEKEVRAEVRRLYNQFGFQMEG